jgi:hypothetical protein
MGETTSTRADSGALVGRRRWRVLLAVAACLLVAGCAGSPLGGTDGAVPPVAGPSPSPHTSEPLRACTQIGCLSTLTFASDQLAEVLGGRRDLDVTACLDGRCSTHHIASGRCAGTGWALDKQLECRDRRLSLQVRGTPDLGVGAQRAAADHRGHRGAAGRARRRHPLHPHAAQRAGLRAGLLERGGAPARLGPVVGTSDSG